MAAFHLVNPKKKKPASENGTCFSSSSSSIVFDLVVLLLEPIYHTRVCKGSIHCASCIQTPPLGRICPFTMHIMRCISRCLI